MESSVCENNHFQWIYKQLPRKIFFPICKPVYLWKTEIKEQMNMLKKLTCIIAFLSLASASLSAQPEIHSQWNGARVAFLGDSITDPGQIGIWNNTYWNLMRDILGIEPYVYGISGHRMDHLIGQGERLEADHGQEVDAIMVFLGTNDYNHATPIGDWYTYDVKEANSDGVIRELRHRDFAYNDTTFAGRTNKALRWLKTHYPDKQVILLTPIHRGLANFAKNNVQPPEDFANRGGLFIDDYVEAVKQAANIWAVPVIDLNSICGLMPTFEEHVHYFRNAKTDHLHPNTSGQIRMAYSLAYQMLGYPAKFPKYIALSFDDGPDKEITPKMLDLLEANGIKASFFVEGQNIDRKGGAILRRMARMGCDVENHTYSHPHLPTLDKEKIAEEVSRTDALIEKYTGAVPEYLRPPYTDLDKNVADAIDGKVFIAGMGCADWDPATTTEYMIRTVLECVEDGDIILFHDKRQEVLDAVEVLIPALKSRGYVFVTVPELFHLRGRVPAEHTPKMYHNAFWPE